MRFSICVHMLANLSFKYGGMHCQGMMRHQGTRNAGIQPETTLLRNLK